MAARTAQQMRSGSTPTVRGSDPELATTSLVGCVTVEEPETRYALSGDLHVAYQVLGDGPVDLLMLSNGTTVSHRCAR